MPEKGALPPDIPAEPSRVYQGQGWNGDGDWLGTGRIAYRLQNYRPFEQARDFAHSLNLKNQDEWRAFCKGQISKKGTLPADIPANPNQTYSKSGWSGMGDWLGTGTIANYNKAFRPFQEARGFARTLNLKNGDEWKRFCKGQMPEKGPLPSDLPACPNQTYAKSGWLGMGDWLGTGTIAFRFRKHRPFQEAREFARSLNLKSHAEWDQFCKGQMPEKGALPPDIPLAPGPVYINKGWLGMGDWLGTGIIATSLREFRCFDEAREFARSLSLKSMREWKMFCKGQMPEKGALPQDIPTNPNRTYFNNGWIGVGDWLGTGTIAPRLREYRTFEQARTFARSLNLKSGTEWRLFCKGHILEKGLLPCDIPASPLGTYINKGWKGYGDWLGTGAVAPRLREYRHYQEARAFVHSLNLNSRDEWRAFCRGQMAEKGALPPDIPANPNQTYAKSGWMGMSDWLGRNKP